MMGECKVLSYSSRVCENGTRSCVVYHRNPVTDNEKAASFIGWQPKQKCYSGKRTSWGECTTCGFQDDATSPAYGDIHYIPEPDMSEAKNYAQAIELLVPKLLMFQISEGSYEDGDPYKFDILTANIAFCEDYANHKFEGQSTNSIGEAAVQALAKLYDAMHEGDSYEFKM